VLPIEPHALLVAAALCLRLAVSISRGLCAAVAFSILLYLMPVRLAEQAVLPPPCPISRSIHCTAPHSAAGGQSTLMVGLVVGEGQLILMALTWLSASQLFVLPARWICRSNII
jgi:hypothetical protein